MPTPFTCPHCGVSAHVDDQDAGRTWECASCGRTVTSPTVGHSSPDGSHAATPTPRSGSFLLKAFLVVLACGGLAILLLPSPEALREASRRRQCCNNLKQIALAMHDYREAFKCLPPAAITDEDGRPMQSWRLAILAFVEQGPLCERYNAAEPWDSPSNQTLLDARPRCYACPSDTELGPARTSYAMIVGEGTVGGKPNEVVTLADIPDGAMNTICVIEVVGAGLKWTEPRDMTVDEAIAYITHPEASGLKHAHPGGVNALFADGSVHFIPKTIDPQTLRNLLTRDDGQKVELDF